MKLTIKTMAIACLIAGVTSCSKEETPAPEAAVTPIVAPAPAPEPTKTELLTGKNWKMTAFTAKTDLIEEIDAYATILEACDKDDFTFYNVNGTQIEDEGPTKCDSADPQTTTGTWSFNATETILTTGQNNDLTNFTLVTLNTTTLITTETILDEGITYIFTYTFTKQ